MWISVPCDRIRGLDAFLRGDSTIDLSSSLEYVWGHLERVARALTLYGHVPSCPPSADPLPTHLRHDFLGGEARTAR
jgi:hypothetical protein